MKKALQEASFDPAYHAYFATVDDIAVPRVSRQIAGLVVLLLILIGAALAWVP